MKLRAEDEESYSKQLEEVRSGDANQQAEQKIKLEKEMQILEKCMEDMKAVYLLNAEKLDFNSKVLTDKKQTNEQEKEKLKQKNRKLSNMARDVRDAQKEAERVLQSQNI